MNWQTATWQMCHKWPLSLLISWFLKRTIWLVSLINQELFTRPKHLGLSSVYWEEFEDTKMVIIIRKSKQDRQHNGQKKKDKRTSKAYTYNCKYNNKNPTLVSFLVYRTPCSWLFDPQPMVYRIPYPWCIEPQPMVFWSPNQCILNPLSMVYWTPNLWYFDSTTHDILTLYPWYFDPYSWHVDPHIHGMLTPTHGILTPYPWYIDTLSMLYWPLPMVC